MVFGDAQHGQPLPKSKGKKNHKPSFKNHFIKAAIARGMANKTMLSTGVVHRLFALWPRRRREMTVCDQRWGSRPHRADQTLGHGLDKRR